MEYRFSEIEARRRKMWEEKQIYKTSNESANPPFYILDMFPYPSGAGLHVGHPLGYIASDIVARYKRMCGFNVLHPMGYDAFGLPAEQYAIQTGQHPADTTRENIQMYRRQLDLLGCCYDWSREVKTCDPAFYKWTQWCFIQMFHHWYNAKTNMAEPVNSLIALFNQEGFSGNESPYFNGTSGQNTNPFSAETWKNMSATEQESVLLDFRLAYLDEAYVNWCAGLGTVLANDEVKDGVSERGGYPVERKRMKQWSLRITCYANRLINDLNEIQWSESIKEAQRNWIGKSEGSSLRFLLENEGGEIEVFTTRPDTVYGVSFIAIAPENPMAMQLLCGEHAKEAQNYIEYTSHRSERDRMAEVKNITGCFTGTYAIHPFSGNKIPVWLAEYVLPGYGTGAVMGVPAHDSRDYSFARHFNLPILEVISGGNIQTEAYESKSGKLVNSFKFNGLDVKQAIQAVIEEIELNHWGKRKTLYRLRDAVFGRQRYWGEPIPVYYENGMPKTLPESALPLVLPQIDRYLPTETGEPPLARAKDWNYNGFPLESTTMPGWAGSSWYYLRYMDNTHDSAPVSKQAVDYWKQVDLYVGGSEHATGHLLYFRFWHKFLFDINCVNTLEPAKRLVNQGMIQGMSARLFRDHDDPNLFYSVPGEKRIPIHVDVNLLEGDVLSLDVFRAWRPDLSQARFENNASEIVCARLVEKMSKRWFNVINPDDVVQKYGADTLRLFEMFLGPLELSKPWNTQGIEGVHRFLKRLIKLVLDDAGNPLFNDTPPSEEVKKVVNRTIQKFTDDIEQLQLNTCVSAAMICVNELTAMGCHNREMIGNLLRVLSPFAPHLCDELFSYLFPESGFILNQPWPVAEKKYLTNDSFNYPVSINGKVRQHISFHLDAPANEIELQVMQDNLVIKWMDGKPLKKFIFVKGRIINVVI